MNYNFFLPFIVALINFSVQMLPNANVDFEEQIDLNLIKKLQFVKISSINDSKSFYSLLNDEENIIFCEDTENLIIHIDKLNKISALKNVLGYFLIFQNNPEKFWIEFKNSTTYYYFENRPLTNCINSVNGSGGSYSGIYENGIDTSFLFHFKIGFALGFIASKFFNENILTTVFLTKMSYSCLIPQNGILQVFISNTHYYLKSPEYRKILIKKDLNLNLLKFKTMNDYVFENWEHLNHDVLINNNLKAPIISCITDDNILNCELD